MARRIVTQAQLQAASERFWSKVEKRSDGHWLYTGGLYWDGYGLFNVAGTTRRAHRVAWELLRGAVPAGKVLDHHECPYRRCVNPACLRPVTQRVNVNAGRASYAEATHCRQGHPLAGRGTIIHGGRRECRTCRNDRQRERRANR